QNPKRSRTSARPAVTPGLLIVLALLSASAFSQASSSLPAFDAVSVKPFAFPNRPWNRRAQIDPQRLYIEGMAPVELIDLTYSLNSNQLTGLPQWAQYSRDSLYTIAATTDKPTGKDQKLLTAGVAPLCPVGKIDAKGCVYKPGTCQEQGFSAARRAVKFRPAPRSTDWVFSPYAGVAPF